MAMKIFQSLIILVVMVLCGGCASNITIDYEQHIDFNKLKRFHVITPENIKSDDTRLNSSIVINRFKRLITGYLVQRNYIDDKNRTDFFVTFQLQSKQEVASNNSGVSFGFGHGLGRHSRGGFGMIYTFPDNEVYSYDKAIVTIDILDSDKQLIWRGTSGHILDIASTPEKSEQNTKNIVEGILEQFPPQKRKL